MTGRLRTGVPNLDEMLNGGLLDGSITLVSGDPGAGKSTLAMKFLLEGIRNGENGAYISLDEEKRNFFRNMRTYGWSLDKLEADCSLYFEYFRTEELVSHITDGHQTIDHQLKKIKAKRIVIDSVTAYLSASENQLSLRSQIKSLFDNIRKWKVTALLIGESLRADSNFGVDYMVDTIIRLHNNRDGGRRRRLIEVEKMRGSKHSQEAHIMEITDEGIIVKNAHITALKQEKTIYNSIIT
ncbi:MAG: ATPase domain-containing protein [Candidatus Altiarchaeota archaeon]